jgi:hypothetical protein
MHVYVQGGGCLVILGNQKPKEEIEALLAKVIFT